MDNNNNWRGRGNRGRGGGGNRDYNDYNNNSRNNNNAYNDTSNISITSRLGPTNAPINDRIVQPANNNYKDRSGNYNDSRGGYNSNDRGGHHNDSRGGNYNNDRGGQYNSNDYYNSNRGGHNKNNNDSRGGRAFNNYRGNNNREYRSNNRGNNGGNNNQGPPRFTREFVDEDIDMKPETATTNNESSNMVTVSGYPPGSEEKVIGFLTRKSKTVWEPVNVNYNANSMNILLTDEQTADSLCRMNGFNFGQATLTIVKGMDGNSSSITTANTSNNNRKPNVLQEFLNERWNAEQGFLDMDELPPTSHNIGVVVSRLLIEANSLYGTAIKTISFARNKLWSVAPLTKAAELFPNLLNLSIADNDIQEFRSLDKLRDKFTNLQELVLSGNPIQINNDLRTYQKEVLRRFTSIHFLDMQHVGGSIQTPLQPLPLAVKSNFFDQDTSSMAAQDFLSKYLPLFDTNRAQLLDLYDAQSTFSVVYNGQQSNFPFNNQTKPSQRITVGNNNIIKRFMTLPVTMHDLSSPDNFLIDAWQTTLGQQTVLFLVVHGEFMSVNKFSFDRTFLVAPSLPGSRAQLAGWNYLILSDSFVVRNYSCKLGTLINTA